MWLVYNKIYGNEDFISHIPILKSFKSLRLKDLLTKKQNCTHIRKEERGFFLIFQE